jgi:tetratricopeptide (TPR) repeat protein
LALDCWQISYPLRKLGRREEAFAELRRSLELRPSVPAHNAMGDLWLEASDWPRAREEYQRALEIAEKEVEAKPHMMELRRDLADCYERLGSYYAGPGDWRQARDWYAKSVGLWSTWKNWGVSSSYDQRRRNQAARAVARYDRLLSINSPK